MRRPVARGRRLGRRPRVLVVSPHFPPDTNAAAHRVRLFAPYLSRHGWDATVLTVDPRDYEGRMDPGLASLVPPGLEVVRRRALPPRWTRRLGVGDLGLRALPGLWRGAHRLLRSGRFDALLVTVHPVYPALLGPVLRSRFRLPFVLDYQDPWVGAWGAAVGGGPGGRPRWKDRLARRAGEWLEPLAVRPADAVTAVSAGTFDEVRRRTPGLEKPFAAIPLGADPADFEALSRGPARANRWFDPRDGNLHLCYVGTLLPLGFETLDALLRGAALLRESRPDLFARLRLRFFGTSNTTDPAAAARVVPAARALGLDACVHEVPARIDYLDALRVLADATAVVLLGSSERHYTASKLYPALLARRPLLALYHRDSPVTSLLRRAARAPSVRVVSYDDGERAASRVPEVRAALEALLDDPRYRPQDVDLEAFAETSADAVAARFAEVLSRVAGPRIEP